MLLGRRPYLTLSTFFNRVINFLNVIYADVEYLRYIFLTLLGAVVMSQNFTVWDFPYFLKRFLELLKKRR